MSSLFTKLFELFFFTWLVSNVEAVKPVVFWHGMGDCCCSPFSLGRIKSLLEENVPRVYVKSLKIGKSIVEDIENSYFMNANAQVEEACRQLQNDTKLRNGYNAIGFSQGAQFLRAVAQRCPKPQMLNFISLGGQHQGVYGLPNCGYPEHKWCNYIRKLLTYGAYLSWVQKELVQAEYWHDPMKEEEYRKASIFLADINNENIVNKTYVRNLSNLKNLVLVKFNNDTIVEPKETEWFGYYKPGQAKEVISLQESDIYKQVSGLTAAVSNTLHMIKLIWKLACNICTVCKVEALLSCINELTGLCSIRMQCAVCCLEPFSLYLAEDKLDRLEPTPALNIEQAVKRSSGFALHGQNWKIEILGSRWQSFAVFRRLVY